MNMRFEGDVLIAVLSLTGRGVSAAFGNNSSVHEYFPCEAAGGMHFADHLQIVVSTKPVRLCPDLGFPLRQPGVERFRAFFGRADAEAADLFSEKAVLRFSRQVDQHPACTYGLHLFRHLRHLIPVQHSAYRPRACQCREYHSPHPGPPLLQISHLGSPCTILTIRRNVSISMSSLL